MSALDMLAERLASSTRRRTAGSASAQSKSDARAIATLAAQESRSALSAAREAEHERRTAGLVSALARVSQYRVLMNGVAEGSDAFIRYATALSLAEGDVAELFALPILPSDIRPGGRFAMNVRSHLTRHASHIRHGSMLATTASADDIVSEALALCYSGLTHDDGTPRFDLVEVDSAEWVTGTDPVTVPTLGSMYRACRRAYWNELARFRAMLGGRVVITSLDALAEENVSATESLASVGMASVDPAELDWDAPATLAATYWESVATRRPTVQDATLADMLNTREAADNERAERMHALAAHESRIALASSAHPFGMNSADGNAALVDAATAAVIAERGIEDTAAYLGVTPLTVTRRLESIRIRRTPDGRTALVRIAPDARPRRTTRVQRLSERHGMDVTVSRDGTVAGPVMHATGDTRRIAIASLAGMARRASAPAQVMPTLATGTPNWNAGDRYPVRSQWAYLATVSARAHDAATGSVDATDVDCRRGSAGALLAHNVSPDAHAARVVARKRATRDRLAAMGDARTASRLRFLTIARAVKNTPAPFALGFPYWEAVTA